MPLFHVSLTYEGVVYANSQDQAEDLAIEFFDEIQRSQEYPFLDVNEFNDFDKKHYGNDPVFGLEEVITVEEHLKKEKIQSVK